MNKTQPYHVSFIGSGNVASHLAKAMKKSGIIIDEVWSPNSKNRKSLAKAVEAKATTSIQKLTPKSDFYIISVPDDKVENIVDIMPNVMGVVVHTSGITPIQAVSNKFVNSGAFYPLQTFSKQQPVEMSKVPFLIEGNTQSAHKKLTDLAGRLSQSVYSINSNERKELHLAAVFVSNFTNYLYYAADTLVKENNLPFELLTPLIEEVAAKVKTLTPANSQTGPARRNDKKTIRAHRQMLKSHPDFEALYNLITSQIIKKYHE